MSTTSRARAFMLTINNPTEDDESDLRKTKCMYLVYQIECGEEGTEHIQGLVYYKNARSWPKDKFPKAHIERVRSLKKSIKYCMKEDTRVRGPYEFGEKPEQGRRSDLENAAERILEGETVEEVVVDKPSAIRYFRGLQFLSEALMKDRTEKPRVEWIWGTTGAGKTRYVCDKFGDENIYIKDGTQWWNGYRQQQVILIDDFDGRWPYRDLLRLFDRKAYQGQVKGGYVKINSPYIYVTCEFPPSEFWDDNMLAQVERRIKYVTKKRLIEDSVPERARHRER
ncbi:replication associated protein [Dipodfec virus UA23Rod_6578]|uniref:Replication-associated protein n=1 Tax=Dipodfec virus UA23Rod_6578 TaxID=2929257 RepID=A0A976N290_9VIRU|nr:replication associated protein [Dipodfec virus UA23Rod_6578]